MDYEKKSGELASEIFSPQLNNEYTSRYHQLLNKLDESLLSSRLEAIKEEIKQVSLAQENPDLECLKYLASLRVLIDLSQQGWIFIIENGSLTLKMENDTVDDKDQIRYRLSAERNAQFKENSVQGFIRSMEEQKVYNGHIISIRNLIGNPAGLITNIQANQPVCQPYIQMVTDTRDEHTGYQLSDIWRYFRYTWSIPYKTMPGRNLFYLVRDALQEYHPVIGIFALGNSVLNLTVRDDDIGWTVDAMRKSMARKTCVQRYEQIIGNTDGKVIGVVDKYPLETEQEHMLRASQYADVIYPLLYKVVDNSIHDIYIQDLGYRDGRILPRKDTINKLNRLAAEYSAKSINNRINEKNPEWEQEAQSYLYKRKRCMELAKLLSAKRTFLHQPGKTNYERLKALISTEGGRQAVRTALVANRKYKIGSNMMDIIVCGSIPPYNELLGGKLVSILACSPRVIADYTKRYEGQVSEIASRMKGAPVIRDSHLVYLGTTSLYAVGSSQYNRIKVPLSTGGSLEYRRMGVTEGFGTVYFSKETVSLFSRILEMQDGGKRINHVFGEGTSPRFRMISQGLSAIGISSAAFLKHYSPRIVYSIDLAKNTKEFLMGISDNVDYGFDINDEAEVAKKTQELIDFWYKRWLTTRLTTVDIITRLQGFSDESILLGSI